MICFVVGFGYGFIMGGVLNIIYYEVVLEIIITRKYIYFIHFEHESGQEEHHYSSQIENHCHAELTHRYAGSKGPSLEVHIPASHQPHTFQESP
jgi:hypothetical protein